MNKKVFLIFTNVLKNKVLLQLFKLRFKRPVFFIENQYRYDLGEKMYFIYFKFKYISFNNR